LPALAAGTLGQQTGRVLEAGVLVALTLAYRAAVTSLGLAAAT
jgi:hypothetical protein